MLSVESSSGRCRMWVYRHVSVGVGLVVRQEELHQSWVFRPSFHECVSDWVWGRQNTLQDVLEAFVTLFCEHSFRCCVFALQIKRYYGKKEKLSFRDISEAFVTLFCEHLFIRVYLLYRLRDIINFCCLKFVEVVLTWYMNTLEED